MTGRWQYRLRGGNDEPIASRHRGNAVLGLPPAHPTLPSLLRDAGYATALAGKWHLGFLPHFGPLKSGYQAIRGYAAQVLALSLPALQPGVCSSSFAFQRAEVRQEAEVRFPRRARSLARRRAASAVAIAGDGGGSAAVTAIGSSLPPRKRYCQRPVISAKRVDREQTGELE